MNFILSRIFLRGIIVLVGTVMLLSCKNDVQEVNALADDEVRPEMVGYNLELIYSDSARIKYKVITPEYIKTAKGKEKYEEFPKGIYVISYDNTGKRGRFYKNLNMPGSWKKRCCGRPVMRW